jgi:hypothetical protein
MKLLDIVRNLPQENVESIIVKYGTQPIQECNIEMHTKKNDEYSTMSYSIHELLSDYKDFNKFSQNDKHIINKIEDDYIGKYGFSKENLEGVESNSGRIYGYKWDLVKLYLNKEFFIDFNDEERILLINNIVLDMLNCNYFGKGIQMINDTLLTKEYIESTLQNELFKEVLDKDLNISEMRNNLINKGEV